MRYAAPHPTKKGLALAVFSTRAASHFGHGRRVRLPGYLDDESGPWTEPGQLVEVTRIDVVTIKPADGEVDIVFAYKEIEE